MSIDSKCQFFNPVGSSVDTVMKRTLVTIASLWKQQSQTYFPKYVFLCKGILDPSGLLHGSFRRQFPSLQIGK